MFEWESDDGANIDALIEAQKLRLDRQKELAELERKLNDLVDDRIAKYTAEMTLIKASGDETTNYLKQMAELNQQIADGTAADAGANQKRIEALKIQAQVKMNEMQNLIGLAPNLQKRLEAAQAAFEGNNLFGSK